MRNEPRARWWVPSHGNRAQSIVSGGVPGHSLIGVRHVCPAEDGTAVSEDDAALICRAVNEYDALRAVEAHMRHLFGGWQGRSQELLAELDAMRNG